MTATGVIFFTIILFALAAILLFVRKLIQENTELYEEAAEDLENDTDLSDDNEVGRVMTAGVNSK